MKSNRSIPEATVVPVLVYPDVRAAVDWLSRVFGFAERVRIGEAAHEQPVGCVQSTAVTDVEQRLRDMYVSFNARDIDAVLAALAADVDWPNAWEGGRVVGHEAVRDYWTRQWAQIDPRVEPESIVTRPDGRLAVAVHQVVCDLAGTVRADENVTHVYELRDELVVRMTVEEPEDSLA